LLSSRQATRRPNPIRTEPSHYDRDMSGRNERAAATRARLVAIARRLFAERGYARTSTTMVLQEAGLARGALYHHFSDKRDLLRAVYEAVERDLLDRVIAQSYADPTRPLWDRLTIAIRAFLAAASDQEVQQIVLTDAPAVLGRATSRQLDESYGLGQLKRILKQGMKEGLFPEQPVDPLARLLIAMLNEAATEVANSPEPESALDEIGETAVGIFAGLRA
jgi:AcrR family transcriptional regulator